MIKPFEQFFTDDGVPVYECSMCGHKFEPGEYVFSSQTKKYTLCGSCYEDETGYHCNKVVKWNVRFSGGRDG